MDLSFLTDGSLPLQWIVVCAGSLVAAATDLASRRIPNLLTAPLFVAGVVWSGFDAGLGGVGTSLAAAVLLALPFIVLFLMAGGGAGDAKLMGAIGAWLGLSQGLITLAAVCLCGGVLAVIYALFKKRFVETFKNVGSIVRSMSMFAATRGQAGSEGFVVADDDTKVVKIPYGVAIFAGVVISAVGVFSCSA